MQLEKVSSIINGLQRSIGEFHSVSGIEVTASHTNAQIKLPGCDSVAGRPAVRSRRERVAIRRLQAVRKKNKRRQQYAAYR